MVLRMKKAGLVLVAIFICSQGTAAQQPERHWLIGWWQGDLQVVMANPGRIIVVTSVGRDGIARGNMGLVGQAFGSAEIRVDGSKVHVVNAIKSVGEFTREGNDQLVGALTGKDAKVGARLDLTRVKTAQDHPLVGEWWGTWQRGTMQDGGQYYLTIVGVNGSSVIGEYRTGSSTGTREFGFVGTLNDNSLVFGSTQLSISGNRITGTARAQAGSANISLEKKQ